MDNAEKSKLIFCNQASKQLQNLKHEGVPEEQIIFLKRAFTQVENAFDKLQLTSNKDIQEFLIGFISGLLSKNNHKQPK